MSERGFGLWEAFGVEIEYMIADAETLDVRPIADRVLVNDRGEIEAELERGPITWSNELVAHVIELKCSGPAAALEPLPAQFAASAAEVARRLAPEGALLLPTGMHPWMEPASETVLWPHEGAEIYATFDRIFDCRRHGWANLQSVHLNLPFAGDLELERLHTAVRLLLPLIPALSASTPFKEGRPSPYRDARLDTYRRNAVLVPRVSGDVIPEPIRTQAEYQAVILEPIYRDIAPHDVDGTLQNEWLNARGAIARFSRDTIEIRVIDTQEHPAADLAICAGVTAALEALVDQRWSDTAEQLLAPQATLVAQLARVIEAGEEARVEDPGYLRLLGLPEAPLAARDVWAHLLEATGALAPESPWAPALELILREGTLSSRIRRALPGEPSRGAIRAVYREVARCLAEGVAFRA